MRSFWRSSFGLDVLDHGQIRDLADAVGIHDVVFVEVLERRLLEVVDGGVIQNEAIQVLADDLDDLVLEVVALGVKLVEVEVLTHGFSASANLAVNSSSSALASLAR